MASPLNRYVPPVGFYYRVVILSESGSPLPDSDAAFMEVSGISATMETESIKEGGENRFVYKVPGRVSYGDLVLKRGLMVNSSPLAIWVHKTLDNGLHQKIELRTIKVALLNKEKSKDEIMVWVFENAYPTKWEVSSLDAQKSEIVVESLTFTYTKFRLDKASGQSKYPNKGGPFKKFTKPKPTVKRS